MTEQAKMQQMMEEYRSNGGDMGNVSAFMDFVSAFGSDGATPFLKLNQWKSSDKPVMDDFNRDNEKIDAAVRELWEKKADKDKQTTWHELEVFNGVEPSYTPIYGKYSSGLVYLAGTIFIKQEFKEEKVIGVLPEGYRPQIVIPVSYVQGSGSGWSAYGWIRTNGELTLHTITSFPTNTHACAFSALFIAAQ